MIALSHLTAREWDVVVGDSHGLDPGRRHGDPLVAVPNEAKRRVPDRGRGKQRFAVAAPITIVVMGVTGSGKSTIARALSDRLGWPVAEGDDFHSVADIAKMRSGHPLTDADRRPWLARIATWIGVQEAEGANCIVSCSALRRGYRDALRLGHPSIWFAHMVVPHHVLEDRLMRRSEHFMPSVLISSQLETLEPLGSDEAGAEFQAEQPTHELVEQVIRQAVRATAPDLRRSLGGP